MYNVKAILIYLFFQFITLLVFVALRTLVYRGCPLELLHPAEEWWSWIIHQTSPVIRVDGCL